MPTGTINFVHPKGTDLYIGTSEKGNSVQYRFIPEDKLITWEHVETIPLSQLKEMSREEITVISEKQEKQNSASRMELECNFAITGSMILLLESARILYVHEYVNTSGHKIIFSPLPMFDYVKLNDVLFDMFNKFNL